MDRLAKGMRTACGLLLLLNIAVFFLPVTEIGRQNSPGKSELKYSQINYIVGMANGELPHDEYLTVETFEGSCYVIMIAFMIVPFLLSVIGGIYGISGSPRQIMTGICSVLSVGGYLAQFFMLSQIWPEQTSDLSCDRGFGSYLSLLTSGTAALFGILTFVFVPRIKKAKENVIPNVQEMKREKEQAVYHIADAVSEGGEYGGRGMADYDPSREPRGVLVGLTGMYAGAEIAFDDGMMIRLGRLPDNDLVFENEKHVSRRHCEITWYGAEKIFKIKDFSSSGSYVYGSGERVPQAVDTPLTPGTILDIGDDSNRFRLE